MNGRQENRLTRNYRLGEKDSVASVCRRFGPLFIPLKPLTPDSELGSRPVGLGGQAGRAPGAPPFARACAYVSENNPRWYY